MAILRLRKCLRASSCTVIIMFLSLCILFPLDSGHVLKGISGFFSSISSSLFFNRDIYYAVHMFPGSHNSSQSHKSDFFFKVVYKHYTNLHTHSPLHGVGVEFIDEKSESVEIN